MKEKRSSPSHRSSHSHSCYYCYSLSSVPHRHATLTSTRAPPAKAVRHALPLSRNIRHLPPVEQLRVLHVPHNRRHAPAAEHTQRHNLVPPLLHNHERKAQRVLAHVLHAPQPPADQVVRHALHLSVLVVLGAHLHIISIHDLGAARGCRAVPLLWRATMCRAGPASSHTSPFAHTKWQCNVEKRLAAQHMHEGTKSSNAIHVAMQQRALRTYTQTTAKRGTWHIQIHGAVLYFSPPRRIGIASHTHSEARRTPSAPLRAQSAGRRPVTLVPSQWVTQAIVVVDHRCI
ncbi:hypothetical protein TCDM_09049 [Trypanosoma cruzi Dm28c]|uniref:Uncharacterized protein n=1 Tax=Trypanosoma cruzi Dm28c TaxID=1416333 RepID=V5D6V5_TRYCR|nr:hypothetical protein TCDM_09049 [Trypanosoma cruzi Dm28c]